jgi:hypothetical protein
MAIVERYLACVAGQDWEGLTACLTPGVVRVGPFGDTYEGRDVYMTFIEDLMPRLPGYEMKVDRVTYHGRQVIAEISETVTMDGKPRVTPEALLIELSDDNRIARIDIYMQTPGVEPPEF